MFSMILELNVTRAHFFARWCDVAGKAGGLHTSASPIKVKVRKKKRR